MRSFPYPAILIALTVAIGTWSLGALGLFNLYDALIYDTAIRYSPRPHDASSVLLITASEDEVAAGDAVWLNTIEKLETLGARQIILTFTPQRVSTRFYERAAQMNNLVFGRLLQSPVQSDTQIITPWPPAAQNVEKRLIFGIVAIPPADDGAYRRNPVYFRLGDQDYPILETQAAQQIIGQDQLPAESEYWVNFSGGLDYTPVIALSRLLADALIPELVQGKSVLIGPALAAHEPGLHTPVNRGENQGVSPLVFQGLALQTLLQKQAIRPLPALWQLVLLLAASAVNVVLYQLGRYTFGLGLTAAAVGVYGLIAWSLPAWFLVWPPVTALLIAQIATFILVSRYKFRVEESTTRRLIMELSGQSREKRQIPSFYADAEPWAQVVNLVRQALNLGWLIFLERPPGQYHVKEIIALNCSLADIDERRRDYRRLPYSEAIAENRPVQLEKRLFLRLDAAYDQYLTPLMFGGEVLGFWAMGLPAGPQIPVFFSIVRDFSAQIAEMIYHRRQWLQQQEMEKARHAFRYLRLAGGENFHTALKQNFVAYQQRLLGLEQIFDSISLAAVFYNPFGVLIQINRTMEELIKRAHIQIYEMTAVDLLCALCQLSMIDSQHTLRQVFIEHKTIRLPARLPDNLYAHYLLYVRPVLTNPEQHTEAEEVTPFELRGILVELVDVTELHDLNITKNSLMKQIYFELQANLQAIIEETDKFDLDDQSASGAGLKRMKQYADDALQQVNQAQDYLFRDMVELHPANEGYNEGYPVEFLEIVRMALDTVMDQLGEQRLTIDARLPEVSHLVLAESSALRELLETLLRILIEDALDGATLSISLREQEQTITLRLANEGFGMPDARFQEYLTSMVDDATPIFKKLRAGIREVAAWSGTLTGRSALGEGVRFELTLRCW
ncbi:MAG TPA: CHASE2 domain-containing protein [Candidatus Competibacteraceae bacterium]|nr:CHASE2 domain-containing protein [Candidatus Competibacteraceae bacterium]